MPGITISKPHLSIPSSSPCSPNTITHTSASPSPSPSPSSSHSPSTRHLPRPRQLALFTNTPDPIPFPESRHLPEDEKIIVEEGLSIVTNHTSSQLIVSGFGLSLGTTGESLTIRKQHQVIYESPLSQISELFIATHIGLSLTSELIFQLCQRGVRLSFLTSTGKPYAMITSPLLASTNISRREQILAFLDQRGVEFSILMAAEKLRNQEKLVHYFLYHHLRNWHLRRKNRLIELAHQLSLLRERVKKIKAGKIDEIRDTLISCEKSGHIYYLEAVGLIVLQKFQFFGSTFQGLASSQLTNLFHYGYGLLYAQIWGALLNAGLEPFAGFLHLNNLDYPGRPSLVLDLANEFYQPLVDWAVLTQINFGEIKRLENGLFDMGTKNLISQKILQRLEEIEPYEGKKIQIRSIIQKQARHLAAFLRGEEKYNPYRLPFRSS